MHVTSTRDFSGVFQHCHRFPGLTGLALLHQGGIAKKLAQKRPLSLERATQPSTTVQPIQTAETQSPAVPAVHISVLSSEAVSVTTTVIPHHTF